MECVLDYRLDFLQEKKTLILGYSIINGLYSILNFGLNLVDFATPGLLRNSLITQTQKTNYTFYLLSLVVAALLWMGLHGYFLWCTICLYRRLKFNVPPTPPPSPIHPARGPARKKIQVIVEKICSRCSLYFLTIIGISKVRPRNSKPHLRNSKVYLWNSKACLENSKNDLRNSKENLESPNLDKNFILIYLTNKVRGWISLYDKICRWIWNFDCQHRQLRSNGK